MKMVFFNEGFPNAIVVETRSIVMTVETSRGTRKGDIINCKL